jgi:hypothetical protein
MKKIAILAMMLALTGFISGCASAPKQCNLSGAWNYTFEETGRTGVQTGSMKLVQESYALSGESSDSFGTFIITGAVDGPKFTIDGKRNDGKRSYRLNATLIDDNEFEGVYTTDQNTSGTMKGSRIISR